MKKETFQKKWYFRLLQVMFLGFFIFFIIVGFRGIFYGEGEPFVGFIFAGILAIVYWLIMRNKGLMGGFVFGVIVGLLLLFVISKLNPGDEIAGIVFITLLISGLIFSFVGYLIQNYFGKKNKKHKRYTWRNYIEYMKDNPKGLWFKMRLYGWGWVPVSWEGWLVVLAFIGFFILNGIYFASKISPNGEPTAFDLTLFFGVIIILIALLFWICYKKGEKPRWSWGR